MQRCSWFVAVGWCSGGRLAMTIVATKSVIISFFFSRSDHFLKKDQKTYLVKIDGSARKSIGRHLSAILDFAGGVALQALGWYSIQPILQNQIYKNLE